MGEVRGQSEGGDRVYRNVGRAMSWGLNDVFERLRERIKFLLISSHFIHQPLQDTSGMPSHSELEIRGR